MSLNLTFGAVTKQPIWAHVTGAQTDVKHHTGQPTDVLCTVRQTSRRMHKPTHRQTQARNHGDAKGQGFDRPAGGSSPLFTASTPFFTLPASAPAPATVPGTAWACLGPVRAVPLPLFLSLALVLATTGISCFDWRMTNSSRRALLVDSV